MHPANSPLVRRHLAFGWAFVGVFMLLGLTLESLHGFKSEWYLSVINETRRFLFTLAHAHGVLLGVLNIAFAFSLRALDGFRRDATASVLIIAGSLLLPTGFLLGGIIIHGGDPGAFIALSPLGGALLAAGALTTVAGVVRRLREPAPAAIVDLPLAPVPVRPPDR